MIECVFCGSQVSNNYKLRGGVPRFFEAHGCRCVAPNRHLDQLYWKLNVDLPLRSYAHMGDAMREAGITGEIQGEQSWLKRLNRR